MSLNVTRFSLAAALASLAQLALSQNPLELENESLLQFRQEQERQSLQRQQLQPQPDVRLPADEEVAAMLAFPKQESPCFVIHSLELGVEGPALRDWSWLLNHLQTPQDPTPVKGRCLGAQGVGVVMARLQQALVQNGWTTTRIIAPPQDLSSGVLQLQVLQGVVSQVRFEDGHGQRATLFNTLPIKIGQPLNLRDIEQGLENFKRLPTVEADIAIEPGAEPGQSDLVIRHSQSFPFRVYASLDDSGSPTTGKYQGSLTLRYDNWWTLSDLFYVAWQSEVGGKDTGPRGNSGRTVHYSVPWGYSLLSFNSSKSRYHQTVAGAFQNYVYSGRSEQHDVRLSRIMQRDQVGKTTLALRVFHRRSRNFIDDTEVELQRRAVSGVDVSLGHRRSLGQGLWEVIVIRREGLKKWGSLPAPEEALGQGTSLMRLWVLEASLMTPLKVGRQSWNYRGSLRSQWQQTPLTPQDRFSIGGRYTVRGFDGANVLSGDHGVLVRNELSTVLGQTPYSVYAGVDWARVGGPSAEMLLGRELTGGVVGLRSNWKTDLLQTQIDLFVGQPLKKPTGFRTDKRVFGFSLNTQF